jgi:hypothetical protein
VADARATLVRFALWLPVLRYYRLPVAFVAQDGQEELAVPWREIACLFIGGSTAWKLGPHAVRLIHEAAERGLWVHVGRVSTPKRIAHFDSLPVTSIDTTAVSRAPRKHLRWMLERLAWRQDGFLHA